MDSIVSIRAFAWQYVKHAQTEFQPLDLRWFPRNLLLIFNNKKQFTIRIWISVRLENLSYGNHNLIDYQCIQMEHGNVFHVTLNRLR